jgi:hypothetical protein
MIVLGELGSGTGAGITLGGRAGAEPGVSGTGGPITGGLHGGWIAPCGWQMPP